MAFVRYSVIVYLLIIVTLIGVGACAPKNDGLTKREQNSETPKAQFFSKSLNNTPKQEGKKLYQFHCAGCHGDNGYGDGPENWDEDNPAPSLRGMDTPASLRCTAPWVHFSLADPLNKTEISSVASYIRSLPSPAKENQQRLPNS